MTQNSCASPVTQLQKLKAWAKMNNSTIWWPKMPQTLHYHQHYQAILTGLHSLACHNLLSMWIMTTYLFLSSVHCRAIILAPSTSTHGHGGQSPHTDFSGAISSPIVNDNLTVASSMGTHVQVLNQYCITGALNTGHINLRSWVHLNPSCDFNHGFRPKHWPRQEVLIDWPWGPWQCP